MLFDDSLLRHAGKKKGFSYARGCAMLLQEKKLNKHALGLVMTAVILV
jgi:hypothetical protein